MVTSPPAFATMVVAPARKPAMPANHQVVGSGLSVPRMYSPVHVHPQHDDDDNAHDEAKLLVVDPPHGQVAGHDAHQRRREKPHQVRPRPMASPEENGKDVGDDEERQQGAGGGARGQHFRKERGKQDAQDGQTRLGDPHQDRCHRGQDPLADRKSIYAVHGCPMRALSAPRAPGHHEVYPGVFQQESQQDMMRSECPP